MLKTIAKVAIVPAVALSILFTQARVVRAADPEMPISFGTDGGTMQTPIGGPSITANGVTLYLPTTVCNVNVNYQFNPAAVTRSIEVRAPGLVSVAPLPSTMARWTTHLMRSEFAKGAWVEVGTGTVEGYDNPGFDEVTWSVVHRFGFQTLYFTVATDEPVGKYEYTSWQQIDFVDTDGSLILAGVPFADGTTQTDLYQWADPNGAYSWGEDHGTTLEGCLT